MLRQVIFVMECSRIFSLPMTFFSWLVIFVYSISENGNVLFGLIAFVGLAFAHLGTNLLDDYFDYKILAKDEKFINSAQNCKCLYLKNGQAKLN